MEGSEVRSQEEVVTVLELVRAGLNDCEISRRTGIPRGTIRDWRRGRTPNFERRNKHGGRGQTCPVCGGRPLELPLR
jgi:hypothetical protein